MNIVKETDERTERVLKYFLKVHMELVIVKNRIAVELINLLCFKTMIEDYTIYSFDLRRASKL